jgi:hypothetical protein
MEFLFGLSMFIAGFIVGYITDNDDNGNSEFGI